MQEVIKLFRQIQETSSLNDKKKIITDNKDNELFKKCLKFLLDGNVVTGISDKKLYACPGANCLHAHEGSMLRNDEIIVYKEEQCTIKYLIELK